MPIDEHGSFYVLLLRCALKRPSPMLGKLLRGGGARLGLIDYFKR